MLEPNFMKLDMNIVCVSPLADARQRLGKQVTAATNTRNNRRVV
jgi:hypothetical protein